MPNWKKLIVSGSDAALNSLNVANAVTASNFRSTNGAGTPTLISPNNIILSASNAVVIKDSVLRLDAFTNAETGSLTPQAGDLIYNSDRADVLIYTSSKWLSVLVEGDASALPDGILSSSIQIGSDISGSFTSVSESIANSLDLRLTTASVAGNVITFTKGDGTTFPILISQTGSVESSSYAAYADSAKFSNLTGKPTLISSSIQIGSDISGSVNAATASLITTASANLNTITFTQGDGSTFNITVNTGSGAAGVSSYNDLTDVPVGIVSSSVQIGSDISGSVNAATGSLITTASAVGSDITFTKGDGSTFVVPIAASASSADALVTASVSTNIMTFTKGDSSTFDVTLPGGTVSQEATFVASFTDATTTAVTHSFDTRNVLISVYDGSYNQIIPQQVTLDTVNTAKITFSSPQTGTVVVAKGGHLVTGSIFVDQVAITSDTFTNTTTKTVTHNFATKDVIVSVYNDSDEVIIPQTISTPTGDTVSVTLAAPASGRVVVAKAGHIVSASVDHVQSATSASLAANNYHSSSTDFSEITFYNGDGTTSLIDVTPQRVVANVKNMEVSTLQKGTPVYASGSSGNSLNVYAASASREDRMPAAYVLNETLLPEAEGQAILTGFINGVNTSTFNEGDVVYVGPSGGYTNIKPTGTNLIQNLGKVIKVDASNGSGVVSGAGRANDIPNIAQGYAWVGDSNGVPQAVLTSSFYVDNAITASYAVVADTVPFTGVTGKPTLISSSVQIGNDISGSFTTTSASLASSISDIVSGNTLVASASYAISASHEITYELSSSHAQVADAVPFSGITGKPTLISGSNQIAGDISGSFDNVSSSIALNISDIIDGTTTVTSASYALTASYALNAGGGTGVGFPFSGSAVITGSLFVSGGIITGDGSGLSNVTIAQSATITDTFTSVTSKSVTHNFNTKNVLVSVYLNDDTLIQPASVTTVDNNTVIVTFSTPRSGRVVVAQGGHIVTGSAASVVQNATVTDIFTNTSTHTVSHNFGTKNVLVSVYQDNDTQIIPSTVKTTDSNTVDITLDQPYTGRVVVAKGGHLVSGSVVSASYATTASYALNAGGGAGFPYSGSAVITGSLYVSGSTISGSFVGDGSQLTGISVEEVTTITDTFTSVTSKSVNHNFNSKNVFVSVYNTSDQLIIPASLTTTNVNTVDITFDTATSGRVVVGKAGHVVSGSVIGSYREAVSGNNTYSVTHNLDVDFPLVQSYLTSTKEQIIPKTIKSINTNTIQVDFDQTFAGTIVIKK